MNGAGYIDLHVHTNRSDGDFSPTDVVRIAKGKNLRAIAITDHDTIDGIDEAVSAGKEHSIEVIPGIELTMQYMGRPLHILGLYLNYNYAELTSSLRLIQEDRRQRAKEILRQLNIKLTSKFDSKLITEEESIAGICGCVGRMHIAKALVKKGLVADTENAFSEYLRDLDLPKMTMDYMGGLSILNLAAAIPILAHPSRSSYSLTAITKIPVEQMKILRELREHGLIGIECANDPELSGIAKPLELIITNSSDWHGPSQPKQPELGSLQVPYSLLTLLKKAKKTRLGQQK